MHDLCTELQVISYMFAFVLFYVFRRPRGVISTPVIRTFGRGGRYYGRGYKNQGAIQVIAPRRASATSFPATPALPSHPACLLS